MEVILMEMIRIGSARAFTILLARSCMHKILKARSTYTAIGNINLKEKLFSEEP